MSLGIGPRPALLLLLALAASPVASAAGEPTREDKDWLRLEPGLELGTFRAPAAQTSSPIRILRVDPKLFRLRLLNASATPEGRPRTARDWSTRHHLTAAINASMYQGDYRTSVSLMKSGSHTNNPRVSKDMTILAFDPLVPGVPEVQIIDRQCQDLDALRPKYGTLVQSVRMVSCTRANVWSIQPRRAPIAAIGIDGLGRILLVHSGGAFRTHDFIEALLTLPIGLERAMYAEGGSEAQLYVKAQGREYEFVGSTEGGIAADVPSVLGAAVAVPNVIGIERRR